ncbi:MAG: hypothetical protein CMH44_00105 [Muricauda sp.]|nr:hypothetical protein [Allomuricauda sp.]MBC74307.1 hypothetical protein [Allomuricauda sp.]
MGHILKPLGVPIFKVMLPSAHGFPYMVIGPCFFLGSLFGIPQYVGKKLLSFDCVLSSFCTSKTMFLH